MSKLFANYILIVITSFVSCNVQAMDWACPLNFNLTFAANEAMAALLNADLRKFKTYQNAKDILHITDAQGDSVVHVLSSVRFSSQESLEVLETLNLDSSDVARQNLQGKTPLHYAINVGHGEIASFLIGRNPGLVNIADNKGDCPLHIAVANKSIVMVNFLIKKNAHVLATNKAGQSPLNTLLEGTPNNRRKAGKYGASSWDIDKEIVIALASKMSPQECSGALNDALVVLESRINKVEKDSMQQYIIAPLQKCSAKRPRPEKRKGPPSNLQNGLEDSEEYVPSRPSKKVKVARESVNLSCKNCQRDQSKRWHNIPTEDGCSFSLCNACGVKYKKKK